MTPGKKALLVLARAGMEMSWRYAWVGFLMLLICHRVFPLAEAAGAFVMAIILNRLPVNHNWRLYQSLLLQAAGFVFFSLLILYRLWYETFSFFSVTWLSALFQDPKSLSHKFTFLLILFCLLLIWRGGRTLVKNPMDYDYVCIQFDKGVGLFILLLLVKFLIQEKADILIDGLAFGFLACAFFIFSLLSIFLARKLYFSGDLYHSFGHDSYSVHAGRVIQSPMLQIFRSLAESDRTYSRPAAIHRKHKIIVSQSLKGHQGHFLTDSEPGDHIRSQYLVAKFTA